MYKILAVQEGMKTTECKDLGPERAPHITGYRILHKVLNHFGMIQSYGFNGSKAMDRMDSKLLKLGVMTSLLAYLSPLLLTLVTSICATI